MYRAATENYFGADSAALAPHFFEAVRRSRDDSAAEVQTNAVSEDFVLNAALVHMAVITGAGEFHAAAQSFAWDWVCKIGITYTPFGRAYVPDAPLLGDTAFAAALSQLYAVKTARGPVRAYVDDLFAHKW